MWKEFYIPSSLEETLAILAEEKEKCRLVAGATDLMLELERGVRKHVDSLVDVTRLPGFDSIKKDQKGIIHLGPLVTHNDVASSPLLRKFAFPLVCAAWQVGAPQIRNRGTVAGNLITASPANDTITPLMALDATITLASRGGTRQVALKDFYKGVRATVLAPDEMLTDITFPALGPRQHGIFLKLGLRRAQAISLVNITVILDITKGMIKSATITLGAVAPTIIHACAAEESLVGKELNDETISNCSKLAAEASQPIDDIRGSAAYRREMVKVLVLQALRILRDGGENGQVPANPIILSTKDKPVWMNNKALHYPGDTIHTTVNGKPYSFSSGYEKSLLRLLREEADLIGTKEGCAEGECGACTVFLDGKAVMACLVPAPRAHGAEIVTVEGLSKNGSLHAVQETFISHGAVQCGYCTPGFIMSSAKLLEENPYPSREEITQAISGNLCRCTGYYKIIRAVEHASQILSK